MPLTVIPAAQWRASQARHVDRVVELTSGHQSRAGLGIPHPVEDFLFTYYSLRPAQIRRWYPGAGVALADAPDRAAWRFHRVLPPAGSSSGAPGVSDGPSVAVDAAAFVRARSSQSAFTRRLLAATGATPGQFGCFGLHEWAMVYRQDESQRRHLDRPLRLGQAGTDDVVRRHQIKCTHYDAFRFFTPPARPLNAVQPDLASRALMEQPGCLHASMDIYKWAYKLIPVVPSDLLLDAFVLARAIRELDMRASPYDLADLGYSPVLIETAAGKAEYVAAQREFAGSAQILRKRLLAILDGLVDTAAAGGSGESVGLSDRHPALGNSSPGTAPRRS
jgi:hypothetical protein